MARQIEILEIRRGTFRVAAEGDEQGFLYAGDTVDGSASERAVLQAGFMAGIGEAFERELRRVMGKDHRQGRPLVCGENAWASAEVVS